jgi:hypothetical protein
MSWLGHLESMEEDLHSKTGRDEVKRNTQERRERKSRK